MAIGRGESLGDALSAGGEGALSGFGIGTLSGIYLGFQYAKENKVNPWTGKDNQKGNYSVYQGTDPGTGEVKYVGITKRDPQARWDEHLNSGTKRSDLDYKIIKSSLTKNQARTMEQNLINRYGMQNTVAHCITNVIQ